MKTPIMRMSPAMMPLVLASSMLFIDGAPAQESAVRPQAHFRVERPAAIDVMEALAIYQQIVEVMVDGYALSDHPVAESYRGWTRYNTAPYRSATHGSRYVDNYANGKARAYGRFEESGTLPVGAILVKDAFTVTADGAVFAGPLAIMEKMEPGFHPASRDWRYTQIMPDGSLFGVTRGFNAEGVEFCITCHATAGDEQDHLFYIPEEFRRRSLVDGD